MLFRKFILRRRTGIVVKSFAESMGVVYIKLAQVLATQNYGNLFTEEDRILLSGICDDCNPISYDEVENFLKVEYGNDLSKIFRSIDQQPIGSASVSQVHHAILRTGEEVAIKIKRKDITRTIDHDIARIRRIIHRFGKIVHFRNFTGGDRALDLYLEWIRQETDFAHEIKNIKTYQSFANNVNGRVRDTTKIRVPKLYEQYCTNNIIVMEFIKIPTINKLELTASNKRRIVTAFNSYIQLSFWAMFHDQKIVFHGDPHSGNICVDEAGNIYFLDMGLLCALDEADAKLCRTFFLTAYTGNYEKLYEMLSNYGELDDDKRVAFKEDCRKYCEQVKTQEVTYYFINMINVCLNYEFVPPDFLFSMAKAFLCLNGISNFTNNKVAAHDLLREQVVEFLMRRSFDDCKNVMKDGALAIPRVIESTFESGFLPTISQIVVNGELKRDVVDSLDHLCETLELLKRTCVNL